MSITKNRYFSADDPNSGLYTNKLRNLIEEYHNAVKKFVDNPGHPGVVWGIYVNVKYPGVFHSKQS